MASKEPQKIILRTYQVGFGDCFLLIFQYADNSEKFVLFDFGSTGLPDNFPENQMLLVAQDIAIRCGGKLEAVVATHRHKDHISGFSTKGKKIDIYFDKNTGKIISEEEANKLDKTVVVKKELTTGEIIRECKPNLVIQPWTENPNLPTDSKSANLLKTQDLKNNNNKEFKGKTFDLMLSNMHNVAKVVESEATRLGNKLGNSNSEKAGFIQPIDETRKKVLQAMGENNSSQAEKGDIEKILKNNPDIKNASAVLNLGTMGKNEYVYYDCHGIKNEVESLKTFQENLGIKVHVLGPPTIEQYEKVQKQRSRDNDEFWMMTASLVNYWQLQSNSANLTQDQLNQNNGKPDNPFPHARVYDGFAPSHTRWFIRRMRDVRADQLLSIVTILDKAMNNTSVILLLEIGKTKKLLFPGDAQIENWEYVLKHKKYNPEEDDKKGLSNEEINKLKEQEKNRQEYVRKLKDTTLYKVGHHGSRNATPKTLWNSFTKKVEENLSQEKYDEEKPKSMHTVVSTMEGKHGDTVATKVPRQSLVDKLNNYSQYRSTQDLKLEKADDTKELEANRWLYFETEL